MKKIILILMLLIFLITPNLISAENRISATLIRYEPLPAQPGQYVNVFIKLENIGDEDAPRTSIEIIDSFPFQLVNPSQRIIDTGILQKRESSVWEVKLKIDSSAVVGMNKLKIRYTSDNQTNSWRDAEFDIEVKPSETKLAINSVEITPEEFYPGIGATITLNLKNSGSIVFRDIALKLNMYDANNNDLPFIPINSITEKHLSILKPGELSQVSFSIKSYPNANPGYYKIPLTITFYDDEGNLNEQNDLIGIIVSSSPELKIVLNEITSTKSTHNIELKSINKGINDLKFLDLQLLESNEYKLNSHSQYYIGDLDSDDYRSSEFIVYSSEDEFNLKVKATYKDENNKDYEEIIQIPIKRNEVKTNSFGTFITTILFLMVVAGIIFYFKRCKKRK